jgi:hypothetical protein
LEAELAANKRSQAELRQQLEQTRLQAQKTPSPGDQPVSQATPPQKESANNEASKASQPALVEEANRPAGKGALNALRGFLKSKFTHKSPDVQQPAAEAAPRTGSPEPEKQPQGQACHC